MAPATHGSILEPCAKNLDVPLFGHKPGPHRFGGWVRKRAHPLGVAGLAFDI